MNKELEEAIEFIKYYMKQYFYEDIAIEDDFKFEKAISIALNHIKNSISKEVIIDRIRERQFELQQEYKNFKDDIELNTLQDLLEGK